MNIKEKIFLNLLQHSSFSNLCERTQKKYLICNVNYGRFANIYITIRNLIIVALYFGFDKIFVEHTSEMFSFDGNLVSDSIPETFPDDVMLVRITDSSAIFYLFTCLDEYKGIDGEYEKQATAILGEALVYKRPDLPGNTVVIHLRGGDIFQKNPHSGYGQPPLAWYTYCLAFHRKHINSDMSVLIVHEDDKNPCLAGIVSYCNDLGLPIRTQSGSLREDYGFLMQARHLIDSVSTFTYPAIDQNRHLETLYCFRLEYGMEYISHGDWRASPEQIKRMLAMREEELVIPDNFLALCTRPAINGAIGAFPREEKVFGPLWRNKPARQAGLLQKGIRFLFCKIKSVL